METEVKSQVDPTLEASADEVQEPQPEEELIEEAQPGAEPKPSEPRTYTEAEYRQQESRLQAEKAKSDARAQRLEFDKQMAEIQAQEAKFQAKDRQDVEQGVITQEDAERKSAARLEDVRRTLRNRRLDEEAGARARVIIISDILGEMSQKYGVPLNYRDFLSDTTLASVDDVKEKAWKLILAQRDEKLRAATAKPESFDRGYGVGSGKLTNAQLIIRAYGMGEPGVSRADYEKAMKERGLG